MGAKGICTVRVAMLMMSAARPLQPSLEQLQRTFIEVIPSSGMAQSRMFSIFVAAVQHADRRVDHVHIPALYSAQACTSTSHQRLVL